MIELIGIDGNTLYVRAEQILLIRRYCHEHSGIDGSRIDGIHDEFVIWVKESPSIVASKIRTHG